MKLDSYPTSFLTSLLANDSCKDTKNENKVLQMQTEMA